MFPNSSSIAGSERRACQKSNVAAADYDSESNLNPDAPDKIVIFHWNHVRFLRLPFLAGG
jgi:hypothetical protein